MKSKTGVNDNKTLYTLNWANSMLLFKHEFKHAYRQRFVDACIKCCAIELCTRRIEFISNWLLCGWWFIIDVGCRSLQSPTGDELALVASLRRKFRAFKWRTNDVTGTCAAGRRLWYAMTCTRHGALNNATWRRVKLTSRRIAHANKVPTRVADPLPWLHANSSFW